MDDAAFDGLVRQRIQKIKDVLASKGKDYGREDRLHQFKEAGMRLHCTPERALQGMAVKHDISVATTITDIENGTYDYVTHEYIDEKIGDAINYMILLEALIKERLLKDNCTVESEGALNGK